MENAEFQHKSLQRERDVTPEQMQNALQHYRKAQDAYTASLHGFLEAAVSKANLPEPSVEKEEEDSENEAN